MKKSRKYYLRAVVRHADKAKFLLSKGDPAAKKDFDCLSGLPVSCLLKLKSPLSELTLLRHFLNEGVSSGSATGLSGETGVSRIEGTNSLGMLLELLTF